MFLVLEKKLSAFTIEDIVSCRIFICGIFCLGVFTLSLMMNFEKCFSKSIQIIIFIFCFVDVVYHNNLFANIEPSLHYWNKSHLIIAYDCFHVLLNLLCLRVATSEILTRLPLLLLHSSMWPFLYILNCREAILLVYRFFSEIVAWCVHKSK